MKMSVDVGCGTGMSTRNLFGKFNRVLGNCGNVEIFKLVQYYIHIKTLDY